ncbi:MAG TPA: histidine kinase, partial [Salinivirgaceae bacterium]|nr:histidine kinase [Salinivirgaceae bacterium]
VGDDVNSWIGVIISVLLLISLAFIKRIFNIQMRIDKLKAENESKVFAAMVQAEENQKYIFSKELHDGLAPLLSSVKMSITALQNRIVTEKEKQILYNTDKLIDESLKTVKEISNNLSPHILQNFGIVNAIKSFVHRIPEEKCPSMNIESNAPEKRYNRTIETVIYRVLCELIMNTIKHAQASKINISIEETSKQLIVNYSDNGLGCKLEKTGIQNLVEKGSGLTNIHSRVKSLKGTVTFNSQPGMGFHAHIRVGINDL